MPKIPNALGDKIEVAEELYTIHKRHDDLIFLINLDTENIKKKIKMYLKFHVLVQLIIMVMWHIIGKMITQ